MTDSNDDGKKGRPRGRPGQGPTSGRPTGNKPFRKPSGDSPRPFRAKSGEGERPRREGDDRPFRARPADDRARAPRESGEKVFDSPEADAKPWAPREGGERFARPRGDKPFATRSDGDRPFKPRGEFKPRTQAGDRPFRSRGSEGEKPFRPRREDSERPTRGRSTDSRPPKSEAKPTERPRSGREAVLDAQAHEPAEDRIAKVIARAGIASRRDVEAMIAEGRITLNGKVLDSPAINVTPADQITVDGEPLPTKERTRLWLYHKPRGLVTTARDPEGRPTVFDNLPEDLPRVVAIGRLDINTEGLLLLTNDGGLARVIAHPNTGWLRRYKVRAHGEINQAQLDDLRRGVTVDGMEYGPIDARLDRVQGDNAWISLGLREGKNREVKRILEHLGLQVNRLIRLSFGPFQLGEIEEGMVEEIKTKILRDQLGDALAQEAGVDFESPVREPIAPFGTPAKADREEHHERPSRAPRERNEERPRGRREGDAREERPRFSRAGGERPTRDRGADARPGRGRDEEAAPKRPSRLETKTSIWRASDTDETSSKKIPRRGADPRAARAVAAERPRQRAAAIESSEGRKVKVERLVSAPRDEEAARKPRREGFRSAPAGDDRPRRRPDSAGAPPRREREGSSSRPPRRDDDRPARPSGDRPFRARTEGESGPRRPQGERPFRARTDEGERPRSPRTDRPQSDRPFRARSDDGERPRGPRPQGDRPFRARPEGDSGPRKPQGDRPFRARSDDGERPRGPRPQGDRPFRAGGNDGPRRGPPRGEGAGRGAPRGGPKGGAGGGFKSGPRGGSGGGFKGGPKGGPKGRRP